MVLGQDVLILPEMVQSTLPVSMVATRSQTKTDSQRELEMMPFSKREISSPEKIKAVKTHQQRR